MVNRLHPDAEIKLTDIFRTLFNDPTLVLRDDLVAPQVPGWDSFNHINLVMQIEEDFAVRFTTDEIASLANVGEFKALIARKLAARDPR
jgi:acyl carrier protein